MAQPVKTKLTVVEKPLTCAWWVWRAEKDYEGLTEILDRAMYAESTEERERAFGLRKEAARSAPGLLPEGRDPLRAGPQRV